MEFVILLIVAISAFIWFKIASKPKSKFGVNFKRVNCPVCGTTQPIIRMPANINQAMYGGWTCANCKTNMDKYGIASNPS